MLVKKLVIASILLVTVISLCFAMSSGDKAVDKQFSESEIKLNIKQGMSLDEVKSYLDEKSIKYFVEKKENTVHLAFTIGDGSSGRGLSTVEKYILFTVKFDNGSLVNNLEIEDVYKGL